MSNELSVITAAVAVLGLLLSVLNTWNAFRQGTVRLRPRAVWISTRFVNGRPLEVSSNLPSAVGDLSGGVLGVEVINRSAFDVVVQEVGFCPRQERFLAWFRCEKQPADRKLILGDAGRVVTLPHALRRGARVLIVASRVGMLAEGMERVGSAYVTTSDERTFVLGSEVVRAVARKLRAMPAAQRRGG